MTYSRIVLSSGHGKYVKGAVGVVDEVTEARRVVDHLADELERRGVDVAVFHDNTSKSQGENLNTIVDAHNSADPHDLDVSVHFNAFDGKAHGVEVLYVSQKDLAAEVSAAIASVGLTNRGAKFRDNLKFLNSTKAPAILLEICFCDNSSDVALYQKSFGQIIFNIAEVLGGAMTDAVPPDEIEEIEPPDVAGPVEPRVEVNVEGDVRLFINGQEVRAEPEPPPPSDALFHVKGKCSWFGGPNDTTGVSASEGLAFHFEINTANQHLFLPLQPAGTSGLARRLNAKAVRYLACRWDYTVTDKKMLAGDDVALVRAPRTGRETTAFPADWGPSDTKTDRVADLSECLMEDLGITTDDVVEVFYPYRGD